MAYFSLGGKLSDIGWYPLCSKRGMIS